MTLQLMSVFTSYTVFLQAEVVKESTDYTRMQNEFPFLKYDPLYICNISTHLLEVLDRDVFARAPNASGIRALREERGASVGT